jgi:hypothetical protein
MGFYILPRAGNKAATAYKGQGKDTCKVIRIKIEVYKRAPHTPSWTRGLLSFEDLGKQLSTIVPR